jgi:acetylornithine deacetylase/succinyl-diaminopimelate desuccinylase-like protein
VTDVGDYVERNLPRHLIEFQDFLRIPSISSISAHAGDVARAGEWVAERLRAAGIKDVRTFSTEAHPVVFGQWTGAADRPTVMVYGHFDVQPVDPIEDWRHPPFEPVVREERIYARGASDDKGNMLIPILAAEAMLSTAGEIPINLKFFFEGDEEAGSRGIPELLEVNRDLFSCDLVLSADGGQWSEDQPSLPIARRGACGLQIDVRGPSEDLHSGVYGGAIQNPIHVLAYLLDSMRGPDGRILVEGFYDGVEPPSEEERDRMASLPFDECAYAAHLGVDELFGEHGFTALERIGSRPTLEINGIYGGFTGEGHKSIIPASAHAKVTCRLVPGQDPERIVERITDHLLRHSPQGVEISVASETGGALPYAIPLDHPGNRAAAVALQKVYGTPPIYIQDGGTIPICNMFLDTLGAHTTSFSFGLDDEKWHAPNEFFRLSSFRRGQRAYCRLFNELSNL